MLHETPDTCDHAVPQRQAAKLTVRSVFWLSISRRGLDCDDIAVEGIFRVADTKLCFYSYWSFSQPALNVHRREGGRTKSVRGAFLRGMYGE